MMTAIYSVPYKVKQVLNVNLSARYPEKMGAIIGK